MSEYVMPDIGLKNIPDAVRAKMFKEEDSFPYGGQWIFTGVQGSGKTLLLMHCVKMIYEKYPKVMIVSNISIFGIPCIPYTGVEDFDKYTNGKDGVIFVIDEIQVLYNALESKNMPLSTIEVWAQSRKNRRLILGTTQRYSRAAKAIREQTAYHFECRKALLWVFYRYRVLDGSNYDDNGEYRLPEGEKMPSVQFYVPNFKVMTMYNTLEVVRRVDNHS